MSTTPQQPQKGGRAKEVLGTARLPGGQELTLLLEGGFYHLVLDGVPLMSSAAHFTEEHIAAIGLEGREERANTRVLVGGLGMGYTLRAALDRTTATSRIVVAELVPEVVTWNEGPLAELAGRPLEDPRTELVRGDIVAYLNSAPKPFDAILLDTDNGPDDFTAKGNAHMYTPKGLERLRRLLRPGGRLVVWSAYQCPPFIRALQHAGYEARVVKAKSRGEKGGRHWLYVGEAPEEGATRPAPPRPQPKQPDRRKRRRRSGGPR